MSVELEKTLTGLSDLNLWYKIKSNNSLTLTDMPELIRLRWNYFRDNWEYIKKNYEAFALTYTDPDKLRSDIVKFDLFIKYQRTSKSTSNPFDNSDVLLKFYTIFDTTLITNVPLSYEERQIVDNKVRSVTSFTRHDFLLIRDLFQIERDNLADKVGTTDTDYNRIFARSAQQARVKISNKDVNKMYEVNDSIKAIDFILANVYSLNTASVDPFALARTNANNPQINIGQYSSGSLVRLNYNENLESLAARTLGDPNKWLDIAIANGLKAPYLDEVGEKLLLISNASSNQINIASLNVLGALNIDKFYINQIIFLQSNIQTFPEQRSILNIRQVPISGEIVLELSGAADLDRYKLSEGANIRIYKPNTTNSGFFILIPSTEVLQDNVQGDEPWFLKASNVVEKRQKVDLYIDDSGELNFGSGGDLQLSYGLANSIQAVKLKMSVEKGELIRHREYGLVNVIGNINANVEQTKASLIDSITRSIGADERFSRIESLDVRYLVDATGNGATGFQIILSVLLAGSNQLVPITFSINA